MIPLGSEASIAAGGSPCRICGSGLAYPREGVRDRAYLQCWRCEGTFVELDDLPSEAVERSQYALHENNAHDPRYRQFVGRLVAPLIERLAVGAHGLDYGCGDGPAGAAMLAEAGFDVTLYDPFFAPDLAALERDYDFIFCSEVVEHFHDPFGEFAKLDRLLRPGGTLAILTGMEYVDVNFASWHYRRDPTHVAFYKPVTMMQIARDRGWQAILPDKNTVLFRKQG